MARKDNPPPNNAHGETGDAPETLPQDTSRGEAGPPATEPVKKTRKPRTAKASTPQLTTDELAKFAAYVEKDLETQRADTAVPLSAVGDLFLLDKKLKQMIGGGNAPA